MLTYVTKRASYFYLQKGIMYVFRIIFKRQTWITLNLFHFGIQFVEYHMCKLVLQV